MRVARGAVRHMSIRRCGNGFAIGSVIAVQVRDFHRVAFRVQIVREFLRDHAAIESIRAALGHLLQHPREVWILQRVAGDKWFAVAEEKLLAALVFEKVLAFGGERVLAFASACIRTRRLVCGYFPARPVPVC